MHSEILALTLQHARPRRCRSPACFSIPSHFLFLLNYPRLKSLAPLESFHGRRLKSGSLRAFAPAPLSTFISNHLSSTSELVYSALEATAKFSFQKKYFRGNFILA